MQMCHSIVRPSSSPSCTHRGSLLHFGGLAGIMEQHRMALLSAARRGWLVPSDCPQGARTDRASELANQRTMAATLDGLNFDSAAAAASLLLRPAFRRPQQGSQFALTRRPNDLSVADWLAGWFAARGTNDEMHAPARVKVAACALSLFSSSSSPILCSSICSKRERECK